MEKQKPKVSGKEISSIHEHIKRKPKVSTKSKINKEIKDSNTLIMIMAVLVVMAGIQVFQTQQLLGAVSSGAIKTGAQTQQGSPIGSPSQVGGCG